LLTTRSLFVAFFGLLALTPITYAHDLKTQADPNGWSVSASGSSAKKHGARAVVEVEINAPKDIVWGVLTDFQHYPRIFKRIESCAVTKRQGDLVFTETYLKHQLFVQEPLQHEINDLGHAPNQLTWRALDGNFKSMDGVWELTATGADRCRAVYTLEVDPGSLVPPPLVSLLMHSMQHEITTQLKHAAESDYKEQVRTSSLPQPHGREG
jgi:ribosome-associated toxin RatA of RatAB toxin-antitoxin module